jgi:transcriptional regulator with XRE-family HTH domain
MSDLIAEEIRVALTRQRMSQRQFAAKLGVSPAWLNYRLTGVQEIGVNDLKRIADALGVGVYDLLPPPEVAAQATGTPAIAHYFDLPDRTSDQRQRPPDNRPSGGPGRAAPGTITRTAHLPRSNRRRRDR